ncbi:MAG: alpha/beta hydrolase [Acidimicrobiales bacterium]
MPRRRGPLLLAAVLLIGACSAADQRTPEGSSSSTTRQRASTTVEVEPPPSTTTTVALPPPVPVAWSPCGGGVQCGAVTVPIDYLDHAKGTLELAVVRRPAGDAARRIGTLVVNPGGPGASGTSRVRRGFRISDEIAARFDIVGFDPRGVGDSTPVMCGASVPAFRAVDLAPDSPEEEAQLAATARAVADECTATEGVRLGHLGTREVAHDLEVIRRSLGEPQISFVGLSYGTLIGLLWAEAHPTSVRALVLDGVVDPAATADATSIEQVTAIERSMGAIDAACRDDPSCPLADAGGVLAAYDELARRIEAGETARRGISPTQLAYAVFSATYGRDRWPLLWDALRRGLDGDLGGVAEMADWFTSLVEYAPFAIVTCLDSRHPVGVDAWRTAADRAAAASERFGRIAANELLPCAHWPAGTYEPHPVSAPGVGPTLVIGSTGDVATPFEQAERVAAALAGGVLLTVDQAGHIAIDDSACVDDAVTRYLVDLAVPAPGSRCS